MKTTRTGRFRKDYKRAVKQSKDIKLLKKIIKLLSEGKNIPKKYCNHKLSGSLKNYMGLHLEPDWLLIYHKKINEIALIRLGSHSDLFK